MITSTPLDGVPDMPGVMIRFRWWRFGVADMMECSRPMDARARWVLRQLVIAQDIREIWITVTHPAATVRPATVLRRQHPDLPMLHLYEPSWTTWPLVHDAARTVDEAVRIIDDHQRRVT